MRPLTCFTRDIRRHPHWRGPSLFRFGPFETTDGWQLQFCVVMTHVSHVHGAAGLCALSGNVCSKKNEVPIHKSLSLSGFSQELRGRGG